MNLAFIRACEIRSHRAAALSGLGREIAYSVYQRAYGRQLLHRGWGDICDWAMDGNAVLSYNTPTLDSLVYRILENR